MRKRRLTKLDETSVRGINATPLIDVVMCLIVFFLIVGKLASDRGVNVRLPQARSGQDEGAGVILVVTVAKIDTPEGEGEAPAGWAAMGISVQVDGQYVADAMALEGAVRGRLSEQPLTSLQVRADRDLSFGLVEPVLRAAGMGGAKSVHFATEKPS